MITALRARLRCTAAMPALLATAAFGPALAQRPVDAPLPPAPPGREASAADARAVRELLDRARGAAMRRDTATLQRLVGRDFVFIHSSGHVDDVPAFMEFAARVRADSTRELSPAQYRTYGAARDVVLVLSHTGVWEPGRGWNQYRATDLVRREAGQWHRAAHQSTRQPTEVRGFRAVAPAVLDQ